MSSRVERRRLAEVVSRRAACAGSDADFFPEPWEDATPAQTVCRGCPVRGACLALAVARAERYGVWGGLTEAERDRLRQSHALRSTAAGASREAAAT